MNHNKKLVYLNPSMISVIDTYLLIYTINDDNDIILLTIILSTVFQH